jgi:type I restriction enzyme S subunit
VTTLGDVCNVRSSLVDPTRPEFARLPHIAPDSIEKGSGRLLGYRTAGEDGVTSGKYRFEAGDVLYSKIRPNLNKVALVDLAGVCSADMYALDVDRNLAIPEYVAYVLRSQDFLDYATSLSNRANIPKLNREQLVRYDLHLPPLPEQRRIAAILHHADALRAKRRQVLMHLDELTQSIFYDMFGDPDAATENVPFGEVATLAGGRNLVGDDSAADSEYRVLKISAVTTGRFKPDESKPLPPGYVPPKEHLVRQGDLLMSRANTTDLVGAVAYVTSTPPNLALPDKVWRFVWTSGAEPTFWHALLSSPAIRRRISRLASGTGGSMKNVAKAKLQVMPVPNIKLDRQLQFADRSAHIEAERVLLQRALTADDELLYSLQSRAFGGDLK